VSLHLVDLDTFGIRQLMLEEIELDIQRRQLYLSPRLSQMGVSLYPDLLRAAARSGSDSSLAAELRNGPLIRATEERRTPKGGATIAKVPVTAADTLAEGEFNRFYARALCRHAIAAGIMAVEVYRAKTVEHPRAESLVLLGSHLPPQQLLDDLRQSIGTETALGLPPGPNSGLSIRLPVLVART